MPTALPTSISYITITKTSSTTQTPVLVQSATAKTALRDLTRAQASGITAAALVSLFILAGIGLAVLCWRRRIRFVLVSTIETEEPPTVPPQHSPTAFEVPNQALRQSPKHIVDPDLGNEELNEEESLSLLESIMEIYETPFLAGSGSPVPVSAFSVSSDGDGRVAMGHSQRVTWQDSLPGSSDQRDWYARRNPAS
ncbi:hypothetical protein LTR78_009331 [Recurvomyces mirabilis]|uniref:Uncharacterized protein n=1 Tax=Recurvomyces mirabilis TaxID=574656 RepID=A0AAE0TPP3_9PEZI|nr:hypothetical protein LTR78_009331 [Recurvomyces mirabilis]